MNRTRRLALRGALTLLILVGILYTGDYAFVKYRLSGARSEARSGAGSAANSPSGPSPAAPGGPLDTVQVQRTYEIPHKDGRAEFAFAEPQTVTCVRSIFPHLGYSPCWYLKRHSQQMIPM